MKFTGSYILPTGKKTPGGAGTHTGHTGTRITQTNLTTIQPTNPRPSGRGPHTVAGSRVAQGRPGGRPLAQLLPRPLPPRPLPVKRHRGEPGRTGSKTPGGAGTHTRQTPEPHKLSQTRSQTGKKSRKDTAHRGEPGHTRDTRDTRTHGSHRPVEAKSEVKSS